MKTFTIKPLAMMTVGGLLAGFAACQQDPGYDSVSSARPYIAAASDIDAGRYFVTIGGCNDCHTPGWDVTGGAVPEEDWLVGSPVGWRGPWGTTYASNLRLVVDQLDEDAFVTMLATRTDRPPMPWMNMNRMNPDDARSVYRFIRSLGLRGERMPAATGPGVEPLTPYYLLEPTPPRLASSGAGAQATE